MAVYMTLDDVSVGNHSMGNRGQNDSFLKQTNILIILGEAFMKKLTLILMVSALVFGGAGIIQASIQDRPEYVPSSDLVLGSYDGAKGYQMPDEYQLNLVYQSIAADGDIEVFNDYGLPSSLNTPDGEHYFLSVDCTGGLPIGIYDFISNPAEQAYAPESGASWVQWTLSYWEPGFFQTILAGDILNPDGPDTFLRVLPTAGYRSFLGEAAANNVEIFDGETIACEVIGYYSPVGCSVLAGGTATGTTLQANLVPEPATMIVWALLGAASWLGMGVWRRGRHVGRQPWSEENRSAILDIIEHK